MFTQLMSGFSKLNLNERYQRLLELGALTKSEVQFLKNGGIKDIDLAEHLVENVIGYFQLPMGVATNFNINGKDYIIPMAVEETSIIAAASKTAKWVRSQGKITTRSLGKNIIGQIQIAKAKNFEASKDLILKNKEHLIAMANQVVKGLVARGGGVRDLEVRELDREDGSDDKMLVIHIYCDPCEAMGANLINQACEALKPQVERITGETVNLCILSNLVDTKLTEAIVEIHNIDPALGKGIEEASRFAIVDPYRAATNNKGVLNGIDAVLIACGNDWRAVEAGVHSYATRSGKYRSITEWKLEGTTLVGRLVAPIVVGTVGGVTKIHPTAQLGLRMLAVTSAEELAGVVAAVGLIQNLGALKALSTVGVVEGHMKLHATNLALAAGAGPEELLPVQIDLQNLLARVKRITLDDAKQILLNYRNNRNETQI
ncbi:MAG: hydroxymethylglutaryl-CoA reductase, degradative [Bdellovibrionales bacterium]|nr:hydroxymethylglutaryl-CoA reductase, degradative [Bdellovibrionales bacterium]